MSIFHLKKALHLPVNSLPPEEKGWGQLSLDHRFLREDLCCGCLRVKWLLLGGWKVCLCFQVWSWGRGEGEKRKEGKGKWGGERERGGGNASLYRQFIFSGS